jgi:hypothetical protein
MDSGNNHKRIVLMVDLESTQYDRFITLLEDGLDDGILDGFYFLTVNGAPVKHRDEHLELENRLGRAVSAIQQNEILITGLADTDPETGIEYGDIT